MGKFLPPKITTTDRTGLTLDEGELVYDTDTVSLWIGDGSTAGGIEVGIGVGIRAWTDITVTDANFTAADDTRYYLPSGTLSANRTVNIGSITSRVCFVIAEDAFNFRLTFTGATVYEYGGAETTDGVMGRGVSVFEVINSKLIRTQ